MHPNGKMTGACGRNAAPVVLESLWPDCDHTTSPALLPLGSATDIVSSCLFSWPTGGGMLLSPDGVFTSQSLTP